MSARTKAENLSSAQVEAVLETAQEILDLMVEKLRDPRAVRQSRLRIEALSVAIAAVGYRDVKVGMDGEFCELIAESVGKTLAEMRRRNI
jgi:hypothetical protein